MVCVAVRNPVAWRESNRLDFRELFISVINNSGIYFHNLLVEATSK